MLQLIYLGNGEIVRYAPDEADLLATERKINALWQAIDRARTTGDWRPRPSRLCEWCAHRPLCPAYGGTPPPLPAPQLSVPQLPADSVAVPPESVPPHSVPSESVPAQSVPLAASATA
jgi:putative RecB family exonuclease